MERTLFKTLQIYEKFYNSKKIKRVFNNCYELLLYFTNMILLLLLAETIVHESGMVSVEGGEWGVKVLYDSTLLVY